MQPSLIDSSTALLSICLTCAAEQSERTFDAGSVRRRRSSQADNMALTGLLLVTRRYEIDSSILDLYEFIRVQALDI
jgi:hypothetical protein